MTSLTSIPQSSSSFLPEEVLHAIESVRTKSLDWAEPVALTSQVWYRVHGQMHAPINFSMRATNRWNTAHKNLGTLCLGHTKAGCVLEALARKMNHRYLTKQVAETHRLVRIDIADELRIADLRGDCLSRLHMDMSILYSCDYKISRKFCEIMMDHPDKPEGMLCESKYSSERWNLVLWGGDRVKKALTHKPISSVVEYLESDDGLMEIKKIGFDLNYLVQENLPEPD